MSTTSLIYSRARLYYTNLEDPMTTENRAGRADPTEAPEHRVGAAFDSEQTFRDVRAIFNEAGLARTIDTGIREGRGGALVFVISANQFPSTFTTDQWLLWRFVASINGEGPVMLGDLIDHFGGTPVGSMLVDLFAHQMEG